MIRANTNDNIAIAMDFVFAATPGQGIIGAGAGLARTDIGGMSPQFSLGK